MSATSVSATFETATFETATFETATRTAAMFGMVVGKKPWKTLASGVAMEG